MIDKKVEFIKTVLLDLVSGHKDVLFGYNLVNPIKKKQSIWKLIHSKMVSMRLIHVNRDWQYTRRQWYYLTSLARKSRNQFLLGRIHDLPDFDKKLLTISGIPVEMDENQSVVSSPDLPKIENKTSLIRDHFEIFENKFSMDEVKSKEALNKADIDLLNRKVNEQRFKLQQCKLLKRRHEINNIQDKNIKEKFMKLF